MQRVANFKRRRVARVAAATGLALLTASICAAADERPLGPGDYGYRHDEYHALGIIDELQRKTGSFCCHGGECRASYVKLAERKVLVDGRWCPIGHRTHMRSDIVLPDHFALVCAGKSEPGPLNQCPPVFCIVLAPGS